MNSRNQNQHFLDLPHGRLSVPSFMPDATFGVVRSIDASDLTRCGIQAVVMNTFHLMQHPGSSVIQALGGLHNFSGWIRPIVTDSGGFQAYSLIRQNSKFGSLTDRGIVFRPGCSSRKILFTPEKSIKLQLKYGSDLLICLDDCTHIDEPFESQEESVTRTIHWAKRSKTEFEKRIGHGYGSRETRPLLFAVVQGGGSYQLRRNCAESLLRIGFDGFAYGGYPFDSNGNLLTDTIRFTRELIPKKFPMIALGIGHPANVMKCLRMGYGLFDSSMPTRDARQGRLYVSSQDFRHLSKSPEDEEYSYLYIQDKKHVRSKVPISPHCDCLTCSNYSRAYLHHLFKIRDFLYSRLATIHNLRFVTLLIMNLKSCPDEKQRNK